MQVYQNLEMMKSKCHEIVKYKPENYRDMVYCVDEWTSVSDIGHSFEGTVLTLEEYISMENNYLNAVKDILIASGCKYMTIYYAEIHPRSIKKFLRKSILHEPVSETIDFITSFEEEQRITIDTAIALFRYCLRDYIYIEFTNNAKGVAFDSGYDYYMHVKTPLDEATLRTIVTKHNLYLDPR